MGLFSDYLSSDYEGSKIEVEGHTSFTAIYRLIIDGEVIDQVRILFGTASLRGQIQTTEEKLNVRVKVEQGILGAKFKLFIDGAEYQFRKLY